MRPVISAIILAAGCSSRMGEPNKLLLPWGERNVLQSCLDTVHGANVDEVVLVLGYQADRVVQQITGDQLVVVNGDWREGMGTSIGVGAKVARDDADGYLIFLSDLPLVTSADLDDLIHTFEEDKSRIVMPTFNGRGGSPCIFPASFIQDLRCWRGAKGCRSLIRRHPQMVRERKAPDNRHLLDIDCPKSYEALKS